MSISPFIWRWASAKRLTWVLGEALLVYSVSETGFVASDGLLTEPSLRSYAAWRDRMAAEISLLTPSETTASKMTYHLSARRSFLLALILSYLSWL